MGKYNTFQKKKDTARNQIHPIWRGIGFIIMLLTPTISLLASLVVLDLGKNQRWPLLFALSDYVRFPDITYQIPGLLVLANYLSSIPYLKAIALFFVLFFIIFTGVFSVLNAILYRMFGPPRYGALDEPAPRVNTKRYTR